ncbi:MAG: lipoate--protein ligase family protein [Candidatus Aureabacteria bacterium]|nr:lipoate--protein ligase family protein [Candidatus Auribacterota bacterium]
MQANRIYFYPYETQELNFNMALDEVLLDESIEKGTAFFRCYGFSFRSCSIGYFQAHSFLDPHDESWTRRLTGGGRVDHGEDMVISLSFHRLSGNRSILVLYRDIHAAIRAVLIKAGIPAEVFKERSQPLVSRNYRCFDAPVEQDLGIEGRKIAGGALYRRKDWFLYQGSIQTDHDMISVLSGNEMKRQFVDKIGGLSDRLSEEVLIPEKLKDRARILAGEKYKSIHWKIK